MEQALELYIHIPFCIKKCAYCDFLSFWSTDKSQKAYFDALIQEIRSCGDFSDYVVTSVFFGGGTPSVFPGEWITAIMNEVRDAFSVKEDAEITIEANPGTVDEKKLAAYKKAGINRISFGCQSSRNQELKQLGRIHTWEEFLDSFQLAKKAGFGNINVDLMSGLPGQTAASWAETLKKVALLSPEHISAYSLIIEEGTPFYEQQAQLDLPSEDEERHMYEETARLLSEHGYEQYEISNYAKPGKACEHNIGYWTGREYLGLGLGASSLVKNQRFHNTENMEEYLRNSACPEFIHQDVCALSVENQIEEFMILGLRMNRGISEEEFQSRFGRTLDSVYGSVLKVYTDTGYLIRENDRVFFSRKGISVSNRILAEFLL